MSSYDCVLPIDFNCFENVLLPGALRVLAGELNIRDFVAAYIPKPNEDYIDEYCLSRSYVCVPAYVNLFRSPIESWSVKNIASTSAYSEHVDCVTAAANRSEWILSCWDMIFTFAVQQRCAIDVMSNINDTHNGAYTHLDNFSEVSVAGAKNGWRFLHELYDFEWLSEKHVYQYRRRRSAPDELFDLLENLFLGMRCLPALFPAQLPPSWPAYDNISFQGYLFPQEVRALAAYIPEMREAAKSDDELFPVFADIVQRSADCGAGLITIQSGL